MQNTYQKLKAWYHGKPIPYSLQEMIDQSIPQYGKPLEHYVPERFAPTLLARMINPVKAFYMREWKWIISTLLVLIGLIFTYIKLGK